MNNKTSITYLILIMASFFFGCHGTVKEENKNNTLANAVSSEYDANYNYTIDTKQSTITWKGSNLAGSNTHTGYVYISKGQLTIKNSQLIGGAAEVDMNTIEDETHGRNNNLINHLKDPDFFDVKKFPLAAITITMVESIKGVNKKVTGDLTIKGITNSVTFPAKMEVKDGLIKLNGELTIDRTKWDVRYNSGKFYALLADQTISDSIEFTINIVAKK